MFDVCFPSLRVSAAFAVSFLHYAFDRTLSFCLSLCPRHTLHTHTELTWRPLPRGKCHLKDLAFMPLSYGLKGSGSRLLSRSVKVDEAFSVLAYIFNELGLETCVRNMGQAITKLIREP